MVLLGGLAIMSAVFKEFGLTQMAFSDGALRLGVLYDLLGRYHHQDLRNATVQQFMRRYQVDAGQAARVAATARDFLFQLMAEACAEDHPDAQVIGWAAQMHEIGISVAHSGYHKHSAYILANADMPGFSRMDQARLSRIVLGHRGKLERVQDIMRESPDWLLIFSLRLAAILHRARDGAPLPPIAVRRGDKGFQMGVDPGWLEASPLTAAALEEESRQWAELGMELRIKSGRGKTQAAA
jgi:exopolyphosphatase/guanosine-5'-triphosphate,3'-diphosphate pyrophosphatase